MTADRPLPATPAPAPEPPVDDLAWRLFIGIESKSRRRRINLMQEFVFVGEPDGIARSDCDSGFGKLAVFLYDRDLLRRAHRTDRDHSSHQQHDAFAGHVRPQSNTWLLMCGHLAPPSAFGAWRRAYDTR